MSSVSYGATSMERYRRPDAYQLLLWRQGILLAETGGVARPQRPMVTPFTGATSTIASTIQRAS